MSDHVFISYKHSDGLFARLLTLELKNAGIDFWWDDDLKPGENWSGSIDDQIRNALALILLISPESQKSEYVTYEWSFAIGAGVPVFPLVIQKVEAIHPRLSSIQYVDLSGSSNPNFKPVIDQLNLLREKRAAAAQPQMVTIPESETNAQLDRAREEYRRKNYPRALELYEQALSSAQNSVKPDACAQIAYILCKSGELDRADQLLDQALMLRPNFADALAVRGLSISLRARTENDPGSKLVDAQSALLSALDGQPNLLDLDGESWWGTLGGVYRRMQEYHAAIDAYERASNVTPQSSYPLSNLALLYTLDRQPERMMQTYGIVERLSRAKVQQNLLDYWAYSDLTLAQLALGKYSDAQASLNDFFSILRPNSALNVLQSLLESIQTLAGALAEEQAAQIKPIADQLQARINATPKTT